MSLALFFSGVQPDQSPLNPLFSAWFPVTTDLQILVTVLCLRWSWWLFFSYATFIIPRCQRIRTFTHITSWILLQVSNPLSQVESRLMRQKEVRQQTFWSSTAEHFMKTSSSRFSALSFSHADGIYPLNLSLALKLSMQLHFSARTASMTGCALVNLKLKKLRHPGKQSGTITSTACFAALLCALDFNQRYFSVAAQLLEAEYKCLGIVVTHTVVKISANPYWTSQSIFRCKSILAGKWKQLSQCFSTQADPAVHLYALQKHPYW